MRLRSVRDWCCTASGARAAVCMTVLCVIAAASPARAQQVGDRMSVEAVVSATVTSKDPGDPMLMFDAVSTVRIRRGLDAVIRPYAHRLTGGDWTAEMYQLQLRYISEARVPFRVDAGILSGQLGLTTLELVPDKNPTIGAPFFFFTPLPSFDGRFYGVQLLSAGYPLGVMVSTSGARWDARGGVIDQTPTKRHNVFGSSEPPHSAQLIVGGGVTPLAGLRLGAGLAQGNYHQSSDATVLTVEGEYAVGYTRVMGEWIRDRFETGGAPAVATGFDVGAVHTLTPRWFAAMRGTRVSAATYMPVSGTTESGDAAAFEATVGYRLTTDLTLRAGYQGSRWYRVPSWQHAAATSVVWAKRWW
jgi:hypothetical protein